MWSDSVVTVSVDNATGSTSSSVYLVVYSVYLLINQFVVETQQSVHLD